jgi:prevent-host-death family protein
LTRAGCPRRYRGGIDIKRVQSYLGHHSAAITLGYYAHLIPDDEDRSLREIEAALAGPSDTPQLRVVQNLKDMQDLGMVTVQIEEARRTLGELVDRARLAGEPTMILRNRRPGAVLVPVSWYEEAAAALSDGPVTAQETTDER